MVLCAPGLWGWVAQGDVQACHRCAGGLCPAAAAGTSCPGAASCGFTGRVNTRCSSGNGAQKFICFSCSCSPPWVLHDCTLGQAAPSSLLWAAPLLALLMERGSRVTVVQSFILILF